MRLVIAQEVFEELKEAVVYYELKQEGLGKDLLAQWEITLDKIIKNPIGYQLHYKTIRQIQTQRFPFLILFECFETEIVVFRFIHAMRHPRKMYKRKKT